MKYYTVSVYWVFHVWVCYILLWKSCRCWFQVVLKFSARSLFSTNTVWSSFQFLHVIWTSVTCFHWRNEIPKCQVGSSWTPCNTWFFCANCSVISGVTLWASQTEVTSMAEKGATDELHNLLLLFFHVVQHLPLMMHAWFPKPMKSDMSSQHNTTAWWHGDQTCCGARVLSVETCCLSFITFLLSSSVSISVKMWIISSLSRLR